MMAEPEHNPIRDEPVKPPMLNPVVRHVLPSGDLKWILIAVVLGLFLNKVGLPEFVKDRLLEQARSKGLEVEFVNPGMAVIQKVTTLHVAGTPADMWESPSLWRQILRRIGITPGLVVSALSRGSAVLGKGAPKSGKPSLPQVNRLAWTSRSSQPCFWSDFE